MKIIHKNKKEDIKLLIDLGADYHGEDIVLTFSAGQYGLNKFVCSYVGGVQTNCVVNNSTVLCLLDNHGLSLGMLSVEIDIRVPDTQMPDGDFRHVTQKIASFVLGGEECSLELTNGASDYFPEELVPESVINLLPTVIKGEPGKDADIEGCNKAIAAMVALTTEVEMSESKRAEAETERTEAEDNRIQNESERQEAEQERKSSEEVRLQSESERNKAEQARNLAEEERNEAETSRNTAETQRVEAEIQRQKDVEDAIASMESAEKKATEATKAAQNATENANNATSSANEATTNAVAATQNAQSAIEATVIATEKANAATTNANAATKNATTAATNANTSAENANTAAERANEAQTIISHASDKIATTEKEVVSLGGEATAPNYASLPLLCGQPMILFGKGTPQQSVVPWNWKQYDPETGDGYDWNGLPSAIGQQYINESATANGRYIAVLQNNGTLKWINF